MKRIGLTLLSVFYILAGLNHFRDAEFYLPLIPDYLPNHELINAGSGVLEILLGVLVAFPTTRKVACWSIIVMLVLFIPSHIYLIQLDGCAGKLCVPEWVAWVRLIIIHPLLILWAYRTKNV